MTMHAEDARTPAAENAPATQADCPGTDDEDAALERTIQLRLDGQVRDFQLVKSRGGLVLRGQATTYYAKQLAHQMVKQETKTPIVANEIAVS